MRKGWVYEEAPGGCFNGWRKDAKPSINRKHVDGPLLFMRNGELHWLTWAERIVLWLGLTDAEKLEKKHRPHLARLAAEAAS